MSAEVHKTPIRRGIHVLSGFAFPSEGFHETRGMPLVRIRDLGHDCTEVHYQGSYDPRYVIRQGDILIGMDGDFSVVKWRGEPALLNQRVCKVTGDGSLLDTRFLYHLLQPQVASIHSRTPETTVRHLSTKNLFEISAYVPPLSEQRRIAEILDTLDEAIRKTEEIIAKLKQAKQGLLYALLTRGIDENGELRDPERNPEKFRETALGRVPRGWGLSTGEELCREIVVGIVIRPRQYYSAEGTVPIIRSTNVRESGLEMRDTPFMRLVDHMAHQKSAVRAGDVLTVRTGYPGTSCVVPESFAEANAVDIIISRPNRDILSDFLALWANSDFGRGHVFRSQGGLAQQHFNIGEMRQMRFAVPSKREQAAICRAMQASTDRIQREEDVVDGLKELRIGLMGDLLTGKVRVSEAEESVA